MRSVGDGARGECPGKANAAFRKSVQRGSLNAIVAVAVNVIGAGETRGGCEAANDPDSNGLHATRPA